MNLKTTTEVAIESVSVDLTNNALLNGIDSLYNISFLYKSAIDNKVLTNKNTFVNVMGFGCRFFYRIDQVNKDKVLRYERGIGSLEKIDNRIYLKREIPIETGGDGETPQLCSSGCTTFMCSDCDSVVAYSCAPSTYAECLYADNVLISSKTPFMPHMFRVLENSLVGRLDNELTSLSFKDLLSDKNFQQHLVDSIKNYTKQLSLKCSRFDTNKIKTQSVQFDQCDKTKLKGPSIFFDSDNECLRFFDGSRWYKLLMEEE